MGDETIVVDDKLCMGCGVCVTKCETGALTLIRDASKGAPLEIQELIANANKEGYAANSSMQNKEIRA